MDTPTYDVSIKSMCHSDTLTVLRMFVHLGNVNQNMKLKKLLQQFTQFENSLTVQLWFHVKRTHSICAKRYWCKTAPIF